MFCSKCNYDLRNLSTSVCPECGEPFNPADTSTHLDKPEHPAWYFIRRIAAISAILVLCALIAIPILIYRAARTAVLAEERLQASRTVLTLIAEHVRQSPTHAWPTSWADLEKLPYDHGMYPWPQDAARYKAIITVDFTLTTPVVLAQSPTTCTAITIAPGPDFAGSPRMEFVEFLDLLQNAVSQPSNTP